MQQSTQPGSPRRIVLTRRDDPAAWEQRGLRSFAAYRDLGLAEVTGGSFGAAVARVVHRFTAADKAPRHLHDTQFHLVYVLRGWFRTEFEGLGELVLREGDSVVYSGRLSQEHFEYSDDFEVLQVTMPGHFETVHLPEGAGAAAAVRKAD